MKQLTDEEILRHLSAKAMIGGQGPALVAAVRDILGDAENDSGEGDDWTLITELERTVTLRNELLEKILLTVETGSGEADLAEFIENKLGPAVIAAALPAAVDQAISARELVTRATLDEQVLAAAEGAHASGYEQGKADAAASAAEVPADWKPGVVALVQAEIEGEDNGTRRNAMKDILAKIEAL